MDIWNSPIFPSMSQRLNFFVSRVLFEMVQQSLRVHRTVIGLKSQFVIGSVSKIDLPSRVIVVSY